MPKLPHSHREPLRDDLASARADEDRELLSRAAQGDEAAVRKLYRNHLGKLQRHAARILGATDPDVEDVVQQAFLAALDGAAKFDGRSSVQTWLFGIVTRRALDSARARYRRRKFSRILGSLGIGSHASGSQSSPDHAYQTSNEIEHMLASLSPLQRVVFVMHDIEGYTFAEISGLTDVGISTLHARLLAARKCIDDTVAQHTATEARSHSSTHVTRVDRRGEPVQQPQRDPLGFRSVHGARGARGARGANDIDSAESADNVVDPDGGRDA